MFIEIKITLYSNRVFCEYQEAVIVGQPVLKKALVPHCRGANSLALGKFLNSTISSQPRIFQDVAFSRSATVGLWIRQWPSYQTSDGLEIVEPIRLLG